MTHRTKALWIPAFVTVILSVIGYRTVRGILAWTFGLRGWRNFGPLYLYFGLPYLLALAFIGALGAYWSFRAGGRLRDRLAAALAPAFWQLAVVVLLVTKGAAVGRRAPWALVASAVLDRAIIPGLALFIGALPFLRVGRRRVAVTG